MRQEGSLARLAAETVRVETRQCRTRLEVRRQQSETHEHLHDPLPALQEPIAPPSRRPWTAALFAERLFVLWASAVVEDAHPAID
jgi:hypothetical protein